LLSDYITVENDEGTFSISIPAHWEYIEHDANETIGFDYKLFVGQPYPEGGYVPSLQIFIIENANLVFQSSTTKGMLNEIVEHNKGTEPTTILDSGQYSLGGIDTDYVFLDTPELGFYHVLFREKGEVWGLLCTLFPSHHEDYFDTTVSCDNAIDSFRFSQIPKQSQTYAPAPVPTPTVALYSQYTAALSELKDARVYEPEYQSRWDKSYGLLLGQWLLDTGHNPIDTQQRFYEWLLDRKPNLGGVILWSRFNENWKTALAISANPPTNISKNSPALYWYLSSSNPEIDETMVGLVRARTSEGAILSGIGHEAFTSEVKKLYVQHLNKVLMEGKGPESFLSYMVELNPDEWGPKD